jgi:hypothetical protein
MTDLLALPENYPPDYWQTLLTQIAAAGVTNYKIALALGIRMNQLSRIRAGSEPKVRIARRILAVHAATVSHGTTNLCTNKLA